MSRIDGRAKKYNGGAIDYVMLFDWSTGNSIGTAKPDAAGNWKYYYFKNLNCGITYVANGCEPITHGSYQFNHVERAPFVDFIGAVNSMDRGSGTAPITIVIPNSVQEGDIMVLGIMRRGQVSVSDNNSGAWTLGADVFGSPATYEQGTSIYYRVAKVSDAGKTVTINAPYNGRLIAYLSVYRGKNKMLKVSKTISNPLRYDVTFVNPAANLAPIEHESGFMVRAVSNVYAANDVADSRMLISDMIATGPESGEPQRLQVAYKHLKTANILSGITYTYGGTGNSQALYPDVAIILDEV